MSNVQEEESAASSFENRTKDAIVSTLIVLLLAFASYPALVVPFQLNFGTFVHTLVLLPIVSFVFALANSKSNQIIMQFCIIGFATLSPPFLLYHFKLVELNIYPLLILLTFFLVLGFLYLPRADKNQMEENEESKGTAIEQESVEPEDRNESSFSLIGFLLKFALLCAICYGIGSIFTGVPPWVGLIILVLLWTRR